MAPDPRTTITGKSGCRYTPAVRWGPLVVERENWPWRTYSYIGVEVYKQVAESPMPKGTKVKVQLDFTTDAPVMAPSGTVTLSVAGKEVASGRMDHTVPIMFARTRKWTYDNGEVVDPDYAAMAPFPFAGRIEKVVFDVRPPTDADAHAALHHAQHAGAQARHSES